MGCTFNFAPNSNQTNILTTLVRVSIICLLTYCLLALPQTVEASKASTVELRDPLKKQRKLFLKAEQALNKKQNDKFKKYYQQLENYPLQVYLKYKEYRSNLASLKEGQVQQFFKDYKDTPYADRLRTAWLDRMAKKQRWQQFINSYTPQQSTQRQCHYLHALLKTHNEEKAFELVPDIWLAGESQPRSCDPVFKAFKKAGHLSTELLWGRIKLAMQKGRTSLASYLARSLSKTDKKWVQEWIKIYRKPAHVLKSQLLHQDHEAKSDIMVHAVERMARRQPDAAGKVLDKLLKTNHFSTKELDKMYRAIGMKLAYNHKPGAWQWLDKISDNNSDDTVLQWRVRSAIREQNWPATASAINRLPEEMQKDFRWRYWLAAAKEYQGNQVDALKDYYQMASSRSYYSFLAADKMDMPYELEHAPLTPSQEELDAVANHMGILRAREFYLLGRLTDARREWYFTTEQQLDSLQKAIAAKIAQQWGWHNRAIITVAKTEHLDDIELRFPVLQKKRVMKYSKAQKLEPAFTMAVIRRESAFATDARSRVGALGLMQIMPATGKVIANKLNVKFSSKNQLLSPETNVKFGTKYLNMMLKKFYKQPALATAAYNAGGHRVKKWLPKDDKMKADRWIETIPFTETRDYVSSIFAYTTIYEHQLNLPQTRLSTLMPDVPTK